MGKIIISFIQEKSNFESLIDPDDKNEIVYTVQNKKEGLRTFDEFINEIYDGLHIIFEPEDILPAKEIYDDLSPRNKSNLLRGKKYYL